MPTVREDPADKLMDLAVGGEPAEEVVEEEEVVDEADDRPVKERTIIIED